jgi:deazaflavin-dependent oxidoreductase (nitroreductase family)
VKLYQATQGGEGTQETLGGPTLLLTTIGRKSGREITTPLNYVKRGDSLFVVGSLFGFDDEPRWALNLEKTPHARVQVGADKWEVEARRATPEEKKQLWPMLIKHFPLWGHFQEHCDRDFKVFILSRKK